MNYLAHAYLSFKDQNILAGNMVSDFVKGKKKFDYPLSIQQGITLHRAIDSFTDEHPATKEGKKIFKADYGLYGGPFMDIVYDHFLAIDSHEFPNGKLLEFSQWVYASLDESIDLLPEQFRQMFPYMKEYNWLYNYQFNWGIARSFQGLSRRATYITESHTAFRLFEDHYQYLHNIYADFFPEVKKHTQEIFKALKSA
jgi:acyl carrier protein phosphodiesterase